MAGTHDKARVEKGVDAGAPDTESLTERVEGRSAELQAIRGTNEELLGEVVKLEATVGVDPEAETLATEQRNPMPEEGAGRYDFNKVSQVFADLVTRMEAQGVDKEDIAQARERFAKAAAMYAQEKAGKTTASSDKWYYRAHRAFRVLPLARETVSFDAPDARKLDVPVGDRKFITQIRSTYMGLDGKPDSFQFVHADVSSDAPADVRKRFFIAGEKERMQTMLDRHTATAKQFHDYRNRVFSAATVKGFDVVAVEKELLKADALFAESQKAIEQTERMYRQQILEMRILGDNEFAKENAQSSKLGDMYKRTDTGDARSVAYAKAHEAMVVIAEFENRFLREAA